MGGKISDGAGNTKLIFAGCGLGGHIRDLLLKDTGMTGFIVTDFDNPLIRMCRIAGFFENRLVEGLYTILIKGKDSPFGTEEILEKKVVGTCGTITSRKDWLGVVPREGRRGAIVAGIVGRLGGYWSKSRVVEDLTGT